MRTDRVVKVYSQRDCLAVNQFTTLPPDARAIVRRVISTMVRRHKRRTRPR
jgi:hypothetical protein